MSILFLLGTTSQMNLNYFTSTGNWAWVFFIYRHHNDGNKRKNFQYTKRKYLSSLLIVLTSIVEAQNSTIIPTAISSPIEMIASETIQSILESTVKVRVTDVARPTMQPTFLAIPNNDTSTSLLIVDEYVGDENRNETLLTSNPTDHPSTTMRPSSAPSEFPSASPSTSLDPTVAASATPTDQATLPVPDEKQTKFRQEFQVGKGKEFNDLEIDIFQTIYRGNTVNFAPLGEADKVTTNCTVFMQKIKSEENEDEVGGRRLETYLNFGKEQESSNTSLKNTLPQKLHALRRRQQEEEQKPTPGITLNVDYIMEYKSKYYDVQNYTRLFQNWTNDNLDIIEEQMNVLNLNVTAVGKAFRIVVSTPSPTISSLPSAMPTGIPTITPVPTTLPPTLAPSSDPSPSRFGDEDTNGDIQSRVIISVSVLIALSIIAIGLFFYCRKRRKANEMEFQAEAIKNGANGRRSRSSDFTDGGWGENTTAAVVAARNTEYDNACESSETKAYGSTFAKHPDAPYGLDGVGVVVSSNGSLVSKDSLLSRGNSIDGDSKDEADTTQIFADEFDQYKDQNLEKMRADIEGNLEGCDGMMNQAVARALIEEEEEDASIANDMLWGGNEHITGVEIEASALGIIMDWLKRNDKASPREKREIMQETLNKMTSSVRYGILGPNDASRTIHECAGLLGLQLAADIPVTTIIISGMRKKATEKDIREAFSIFGDVSTAAVAPNERGFGILRYTSNNAVNQVMEKFRKEEVVVEDVAVQLRLIKSGPNNEE